ncbi:MAG: adenosylcobinamide-GDP ribazoletransferase [Gammaproteobacteria bacterium]|nr:adenosylcobinamide-GDP ribazoletransferase [Gammaproteobacteria bacterium]
MRSFLLALAFLTRIPGPAIDNISDRDIALSQYYYPLIGLIIGLLLLLGEHFISLPSAALEAALLLALWVYITGALHIDGLADCADAWVGGYGDKDKTLLIMKDPQSGPVAVSLVVCMLLIKFTALEIIIENGSWSALLLSTVIARSLLPLLFQTTPYVRSHGLGSALSARPSLPLTITMQILCLLLAILLAGLSGLFIVVAAGLLFIIIRHLSIKRVGGITGDVAGAMVELTEVLVLVAFLSL